MSEILQPTKVNEATKDFDTWIAGSMIFLNKCFVLKAAMLAVGIIVFIITMIWARSLWWAGPAIGAALILSMHALQNHLTFSKYVNTHVSDSGMDFQLPPNYLNGTLSETFRKRIYALKGVDSIDVVPFPFQSVLYVSCDKDALPPAKLTAFLKRQFRWTVWV